MANKQGALHTVAGSADTRRSPRFYTHAVVGEFDRAGARAICAEHATWQANEAWQYESKIAQAQPGVPVRFPRNIVLTYDAARIEKALAFMDSHPVLNAYITFAVEEACAKCVTAADGELHVLQWSMSERAALKAVRGFTGGRYRNVRVERVERK